MSIKKRFANIGAGILYVLAFFIPQLVVQFVFSLIVTFKYAFDYIYSLSDISLFDFEAYMNQVMNQVMPEILDMAMPISVISNLLTVLVIVTVFLIRKRNVFEQIGLYKMKPLHTLPLITLGLSLQFVVSLVLGLAALIPSVGEMLLEYEAVSSLALDPSKHPIIYIFAVAIVAPIVEEIVFRGLVFTRFRKAMPIWLAAFFSSLIFGILHGQIIWAAYATLLGVVFCIIYIKYRSILANIIIHLSFNAIAVALTFAQQYLPEMALYLIVGIATLLSVAIFAASVVFIAITKVKDKHPFPLDEAVTEPADIAETFDEEK